MEFRLTEAVGEQKSRQIKKGLFYTVLIVGSLMVFGTAYAVKSLFDHFYMPGYAAKHDPRWNILWILGPILSTILGRFIYKYTWMRGRFIAFVKNQGGNVAAVDAPVKVETAFSISKGPDEPMPTSKANALIGLQTQQQNQEMAELSDWVKQEMANLRNKLVDAEEVNRELRHELRMATQNKGRTEVQGFQQIAAQQGEESRQPLSSRRSKGRHTI